MSCAGFSLQSKIKVIQPLCFSLQMQTSTEGIPQYMETLQQKDISSVLFLTKDTIHLQTKCCSHW